MEASATKVKTVVTSLLIGAIAGAWVMNRVNRYSLPKVVTESKTAESETNTVTETVEVVKWQGKKGPVEKQILTKVVEREKKKGAERKEVVSEATSSPNPTPPRYSVSANYSLDKDVEVSVGRRLFDTPVYMTLGVEKEYKTQKLTPSVGLSVFF